MDFYKKIIRSQKVRMKIMEMMSVLPDEWIIRFQYRIKTGRKLDLKNPKRFSEKIQWYKLYYRHPLLTQCADKLAVREYVESKGLGHLLNEIYASYDKAEEIDFDALPNQYAMKANNGCGTNRFIADNSAEDHEKLREIAAGWLNHRTRSVSGEWDYENIPPRVVFEKLLPRNERNDLPDYKFFCFGGEPFCMYTRVDFCEDPSKARHAYYDMDFNQLNCRRLNVEPITGKLEKPKNFEKMVEYARILSRDFPHVRVDFYNLDGQIVFGELTFYAASGYTLFDPDEFDFRMGEKFILPEPVC